MWVAFFCNFVCRDAVYDHVTSLLKGEREPAYTRTILLLITFQVIVHGLIMLVYTVLDSGERVVASDLAMANAYDMCGDRFVVEESFLISSVKYSGYAIAFFGAELGFLL